MECPERGDKKSVDNCVDRVPSQPIEICINACCRRLTTWKPSGRTICFNLFM